MKKSCQNCARTEVYIEMNALCIVAWLTDNELYLNLRKGACLAPLPLILRGRTHCVGRCQKVKPAGLGAASAFLGAAYTTLAYNACEWNEAQNARRLCWCETRVAPLRSAAALQKSCVTQIALKFGPRALPEICKYALVFNWPISFFYESEYVQKLKRDMHIRVTPMWLCWLRAAWHNFIISLVTREGYTVRGHFSLLWFERARWSRKTRRRTTQKWNLK